jgi:GH35 family endo-1,4-beta-xylanase
MGNWRCSLALFQFLVYAFVLTALSVSNGLAASSATLELSATGGDGRVDLEWTAAGNLNYVQVYRDTDATPHGRERLSFLRGSARSYTDNTVENGRRYWYWIKYTDTEGGVGNSNAASATPLVSNNEDTDYRDDSAICDNAVEMALPQVINGAGEYCYVISGTIDDVNSWNTLKVEINGIAYTNSWSDQMPARINGKYYIRYLSRLSWARLEVNGSDTDSDYNQGVSVSSVSVSPATVDIAVGESANLTASVTPSNATDNGISWSSSASDVVSVNESGVVTGLSAGTAIISALTTDGNYTAMSSITVVAADETGDTEGVASLKSLSTFPIGVAVNAGSESDSIIDSGTSSQQQAVVFPHFNQFTAGNIMKMSYLHPSENSFTFSQADEFVTFAQSNGIDVHGHTLVWHSDYQVPDFMKNYNGDFPAMLKNHVQTIVSHYAGKVASWDVVNEALADESDSEAENGFRNSVFYQAMGVYYIDQAFINARDADPVADLFYNDYSIENGGTKTENMLSLIDGLKERGVPITGVGFQMHVLADWPDISVIEKVMKDVVDRGLKVKITELDVRVNNPYDSSAPVYTSLTAEAAAKQKERYREIVAAYTKVVPASLRAGITVWGVWDADSWLNTPENPDWPLLFDDNFEPKPALQGFADGLTNG